MQIGDRLFPYPVLNHNKSMSDYKTSDFHFTFSLDDEGVIPVEKGNLVFMNLAYKLDNNKMQQLIQNNTALVTFVVECPSSLFREKYTISSEPRKLQVPIERLNGKVYISAYVYAQTDILGYENIDFAEDYESYKFDISKFSIMAVDDGYSFEFNNDAKKDDRVSSIFTVVKRMEDNPENNKVLQYSFERDRITISLPQEYYDNYDMLKVDPNYNNIAFAILAIPALSFGIAHVKDQIGNGKEMTEILEDFKWFNSVQKQFMQQRKRELTGDELMDSNPLDIAQIVLNYAPCNGISDFTNILTNPQDTGDDNEQD